MKTDLFFSNPTEVESECLVAVVLDRGEKDKTEAYVASSEKALQDAAAEVISSGEVSSKSFETTLLHHPAKLKAKRLLLLGGGKAKKFSVSELRKLAGAATRTLKSRSLRSFAFLAPDTIKAEDAVRAIVEGAFIGNFDPDSYKTDRNDQESDAISSVARGDQGALLKAMEEARVIGESQNFTRELVNEPSNRMTPSVLADHARRMSQQVGLKCEVYGADKIKELK